MVLVPASMRLLGRTNWYLPSFLRWLPEPERREKAARFSDFKELQRQEQSGSFKEQPAGATAPFFRGGRSGGWREFLDAGQVERMVRGAPCGCRS